MSDTPRTDAEIFRNLLTSSEYVLPYFARKLERENAAMRKAGNELRDALISELKEVQSVAEMFGDPDSPHVKKLTAVIEQWNAAIDAARKEAQP